MFFVVIKSPDAQTTLATHQSVPYTSGVQLEKGKIDGERCLGVGLQCEVIMPFGKMEILEML
jgi:hypothetical protein